MKKITFFVVLFSLLASPNAMMAQKTTLQDASIQSADGTIRCASDAYYEQLRVKYPDMMSREAAENDIAQKIQELQNSSNRGGTIRLPVVVHVVHNGEAVGVGNNISDLQVLSQIDVLNEDYRRIPGSRGFGAGVDTNIEFYLAKEDPNCNPTNGIMRYRRSELPNGGASIDSDIKPKTFWDSSRYLNMWVVNIGGGILGYATFPGTAPAEEDGVVMIPSAFGSNDAPGVFIGGVYNLGRTTTHEVGHYLGLFHTFQGCTGAGDSVADTPPQAQPNYGCPSTPPDTCSGGDDDLIENYMDYSDDVCMDMFTAGQNARMQAVLSGLRSSLASSGVPDTDLAQASNDASVNVYCFEENCGQVTPTVRVGNFGTSNMTSATISYNINGGTNQVFNWTGSLANGEVALVDLPAYTAAGTDTFNVSISAPGSDERACNDSYSEVYAAAPVDSYATTEVRLRLTTDTYSDETSWTFEDSNGTVLYSGGPYDGTTEDNTTFNETFAVSANECYTFTINDAYADGICCGWGNGSYDLRTDDDTIIIDSDGMFGASESTAVAALSLSTGEFFIDNGITVFPNPATSQLTIKTANTSVLPDSYEVYNILGQSMVRNMISSEADLTLDTSNYSNGVYFIKINKDDAALTLRFVKQ
ncbi:M43 family zinc metalloprotease [Ichthyenterobacterium sp. W332]|uniref:M43 family zinc metalloprotease n=1 Tax=Microcosmobacter mediterraneus TaxID=3075607 RepID=A0ABU2YID2_9FLAO|nr:M43 family zinc metalloprotease [Ichthyenterobacterium sp. W332]MDT0557932.1 M43 family zinc metalloprotease [Ichthyenterobacterium sp. W332]